jgi:hypothetical protein
MLQNEKLNTVQLDFINYVMDKNISIFLIGNKIEKINLKESLLKVPEMTIKNLMTIKK